MDIVSWTLRLGRYDAEKPIYIDASAPSRYLTANQTRTTVRKIVYGLKHHGLEEGEAVCVLSFNDIYYTSLFLGIIGAGGCFTGANPGYTSRELAHHLRMTGAKFLLTEINNVDTAISAAEEVGIPNSNIFVLNYQDENFSSSLQSWTSLLSQGECDWVKVKDSGTAAAYFSTSGTSGLPKAAIIPHSYLISQGQNQEESHPQKQKITQLVALPPFHAFTIPLQHSLPLRKGEACYILPRFMPSQFLNALETFQITQTVIVPPIMMALSKAPESKLKYLRRILVGGSCATYGMQEQLYVKLHPNSRIVQVYGMTEVGWATSWGRKNADRSGSVGQPVTGTKLRIVDPYGKVISGSERTGSIQIFCKTAMKGYLNNAAATAETIKPDGWVTTGDIGYVRNGNWYVVDRTKDLIKVRGWQVSPAEIEAALLEHPDILDAGVIGEAAKDGCGETPIAFIVRTDSSDLEQSHVKAFLDGRLARYKGVHEVIFIEQIPRNPTGKILRRMLRDQRGVQPVTADQIAAEAYATALREIVSYEIFQSKEEKSYGRSNSFHSLNPASIIDTTGLLTPGPTVTPPASVSAIHSKKRNCQDSAPMARKKMRSVWKSHRLLN